ncbi:hypothetical protein DMI62_14745 [Escherichia coli]|nr:hypothetical protein [Escherichia coli]
MFANSFRSKEWLKVVADDPKAVKRTRTLLEPRIYLAIEKPATCRMKTTSDYAAALPLREQGLAAVPRLAMYAHKEDCGSLLVQINHPQVIRTLPGG